MVEKESRGSMAAFPVEECRKWWIALSAIVAWEPKAALSTLGQDLEGTQIGKPKGLCCVALRPTTSFYKQVQSTTVTDSNLMCAGP